MSRLRNGLVLGALALLVLPALASARPGQRSFNQTFPVASKLCTNIANGAGPAKLRADATQIKALCATLLSSFTNAESTYFSTVTPLRQEVISLNAKTRLACATRPSPTCKSTRKADRAQIHAIRAQVRSAGTTYRTAIQTARHTFWNAIHALKGGASVTADTGTPLVPTVTLPVAL
jgi:hypothetical protein